MSTRAGMLVSALALAATITGLAGPAHAWCQATTVSTPPGSGECPVGGMPLSWQRPCVALSIYGEGTPDVPLEELETLLDRIAAQWSHVACDPPGTRPPTITLSRGASTLALPGGRPEGPNANTVYFDPLWEPDPRHSPFTIAVTRRRMLAGTGAIYDADIEFNQRSDENPSGYRFVTDARALMARTPEEIDALGLRDLHTVFLHEAGHALGIGHSADENAVMFYEVESSSRPRRVVTNDDVTAVCTVYPPDGPLRELTCDPTPVGGFASGVDPGALTNPGCACDARLGAGRKAPLATVSLTSLASVVFVMRARRARRHAPSRRP